MGANQQATAAAVLGVAREEYTLAGGRSGTAGLTPAQIQEKAEAAGERGLTTGRTTSTAMRVPAPIGERERKRYKEREKERVRERERVRSIL